MSATKTHSAAVLRGKEVVEIEQVPTPTAGAGEVLLKTTAVGVCGSDVHWWSHGAIGKKVCDYPFIIGHETAAVVHEIGPGVSNVVVGDRVVVEPGTPCRACAQCREGCYNLCPKMLFLGSWPKNGSLQEYFVHAADFCYPMPAHLSDAEGSMVEPLSVGVYACERGGVKPGSRVVITGAGPMGIITMLAARAAGATFVLMLDMLDERLEIAKQSFGADAVLNSKTATPESVIELVGNGGADVGFDCAGVEAAFRLVCESIRPCGTAVLVGMLHQEMKLPVFECLIKREITMRGVYRYRNVYQRALHLIGSGRVDVKGLITHELALENLSEALDIARSCRDGAIKVIVKVA